MFISGPSGLCKFFDVNKGARAFLTIIQNMPNDHIELQIMQAWFPVITPFPIRALHVKKSE